MRNKKIKLICATSRVIFRPLPFCKLAHFLRIFPPLEREVLYARPKNIYKVPFSDLEALPT